MIRDKIVFTVQGKLQELLLREDKLSLDKAIQICRAYEQSPLFIPYELIINVNNLGTRTIQNYCYLHFFVFLYGAARHQINFNLPFPFFIIFGNISFNFDNKDRMIGDKIGFTVQGKLQELLLREDKLSLDKAIQICRAYEQSNKHCTFQNLCDSNTSFFLGLQ
jgi:hypothetical protein